MQQIQNIVYFNKKIFELYLENIFNKIKIYLFFLKKSYIFRL